MPPEEDRPPEDYVAGGVLDADSPKVVTFYAYRAVNEDKYHVENVNMGNLEGIMMYLAHEVVGVGRWNWRKFNISKIMRYRVQMKSTWEAVYEQADGLPVGIKPQFMQFVAFDWGQIAWKPPGLPSVGCSASAIFQTFYEHAYGENATYFSFPGRCYSRPFNGGNGLHKIFAMTHGDYQNVQTMCAQNIDDPVERRFRIDCLKQAEEHRQLGRKSTAGNERHVVSRRIDEADDEVEDGINITKTLSCDDETEYRYVLCKDEECMDDEHGGECNVPDGSDRCTWRMDEIGFVTLDELEGRPAVWNQPNGICFWEGKMDPTRCRERVQALDRLFREKYPHIPGDIPAPKCGY